MQKRLYFKDFIIVDVSDGFNWPENVFLFLIRKKCLFLLSSLFTDEIMSYVPPAVARKGPVSEGAQASAAQSSPG